MRKFLFAATFVALLSVCFVERSAAQDNWIHGKKGIYSAGIGGTQLIYLSGSNYGYGYARTSDIGLSLNISGEYKVWNWIGAGFQTGIDFIWANYTVAYPLGGTYRVRGGAVNIVIPIGGKVNAHIMDALNLDIAKKLDVYGGLNLGFGPSFPTVEGGRVGAIMHVGPQVGARYWVTDNIGIFGEFGWGATFANVGVTF